MGVPALPVDVVKARSGVVIDAGFSFTHVSPVFDGDVLDAGVRRIDLGGKALTNYLKELVSFRCVPLRVRRLWARVTGEGYCGGTEGG